MASIKITLPWPPSVNTYYRRVGHRVLLSKKGRLYKQLAAVACIQQGVRPLQGDLFVSAVFCPPDARERDSDNLWKATLDSLIGRAYADDSQVVEHHGKWGEVVKGGRVDLEIETR